MSQKTVLTGRGSFTTALAGALGGVPLPETPAKPTITRNGVALDFAPEQGLRDRLQSAQSINAFREALREALPSSPDIRHDMEALAGRFSEHKGYAKLSSLLDRVRDEMDHPTFDYGDPERLRRWLNRMFNQKAKPN